MRNNKTHASHLRVSSLRCDGNVFAAILAVVGIGLFGLPAGIIASGFMTYIDPEDEAKPAIPSLLVGPGFEQACPHCGEAIQVRLALSGGAEPAAPGPEPDTS